jgi:hypothetical protein
MIKSIHPGFLATHMRHIQKDQKQKTNTNYENEDQIWKKKQNQGLPRILSWMGKLKGESKFTNEKNKNKKNCGPNLKK